MSLFLGIFPEKAIRNEIYKVSLEVMKLMEMQGIPVILVNPEEYNIELLPIKMSKGSIKWFIYQYKLKRFKFHSFDIGVKKVKIGIQGRFKELITLEIDEGSNQLREIVYLLANKLGIKRMSIFNHAIKIARIKKDISKQEIHNLQTTTNYFNSKKSVNIKFQLSRIELLERKDKEITILKSFPS